jgi:hypothetical protein
LKFGSKILDDVKSLIQMMEDPTSSDAINALNKFGEGQFPSITSALFRHRVMESILSHYFPESAQIGKGYFDADSRNNFRVRQLNIMKQKRLRKFFGTQITEEQMKRQTFTGGLHGNYDTSSPVFQDGISTYSQSEDESQEVDKKKKVDKLTGFFGDQLPKHQMKAQHLVNNDSGSEDPSMVEELSPVSQVALLETINELPPEEKAMLTRRAKKLLMMLGENIDGKEVHASLGTSMQPSESPISPDSILQSDNASIDASILDENDSKSAQKQRLDKLSHFLGHRIAEADIVTSEPQVIARPLTVGEKKIYQKKAGKLEQLLGSTVPADSIVNYASQEIADDEDWMEEIDQAKPLPKEEFDILDGDDFDQDRKNKLARLRKLRKMLGISADVTVLTDKVLKDLEESIRSEIQDPEDRALLQEDLERMKARASQNVAQPVHRPLAQ